MRNVNNNEYIKMMSKVIDSTAQGNDEEKRDDKKHCRNACANAFYDASLTNPYDMKTMADGRRENMSASNNCKQWLSHIASS